jgi:hypothetical protein
MNTETQNVEMQGTDPFTCGPNLVLLVLALAIGICLPQNAFCAASNTH